MVEEFATKLKENSKMKKNIIRLQAIYRGYMVRKKLKGSQSNTAGKLDKEIDGTLEYVENYKFPNGAVYTGKLRSSKT